MIDYEKLRKELIDYALGAYYGGHLDAAMGYITTVENADDEQLLTYAKQVGFREEDYIIDDYKRRR